MSVAFVLGGANTLHADYDAALALHAPDAIIAANHAAKDYPGNVDHFVTLHPELLGGWIAERADNGLPEALNYWTSNKKNLPADIPFKQVVSWDGSSGLLGVTVAMHLGYTRVILCGVPLDKAAAHYNYAGDWMDAPRYRAAWVKHRPDMRKNVRSMSGWTQRLLGAPTLEWINGHK
jgi:hypothetical protein